MVITRAEVATRVPFSTVVMGLDMGQAGFRVGLGDIKIYHRRLLPEKLVRLLPILH